MFYSPAYMVGYEDYMRKYFSVQSTLKMLKRSALFGKVPRLHLFVLLKMTRIEHWCNDNIRGKPNYFETNVSHCHILLTINPTYGLCGDRTVISHLSYGTAFQRLTSELYAKTQLYQMKNTVHVNERTNC